jgi:hypothetical protein
VSHLSQDSARRLAASLDVPGDYYVHRNSGNAVFVKEGSFFEQQGGLFQPWGDGWTKVHAASIEDARAIGERILPRVERA